MTNLVHRGIGATLITGLLTTGVIAACSRDTLGMRGPGPAPVVGRKTLSVDPANPQALDRALSRIADRRVILVGETHDRYDHHQNQLAVIRALHARGRDVAVGMEFFQSPFQPHLDSFLAGEVNEKQLLKRTEYYARWRYDYRLYRDILEYARAQGIPLVALNAPSELVARVSREGLGTLTPEERAGLVVTPPGGEAAYEARLRPVFELHGQMDEARFRRFADVQRLWDAYMARAASDFLAANPGKTLVILAGSGHVVYPDAIPGRLAGLPPEEIAILATGPRERYAGGVPDMLFAERDLALEPAGQIGMELAAQGDGVRVHRVRPQSPAERAGFQTGDRILSIAGERVSSIEDVRLALLDRGPGEELWVDWMRSDGRSRQGKARRLSAPLTLL
ncbi:MAG: ChaN family lipoprotein [Bdellovibrio bacteriovorus]